MGMLGASAAPVTLDRASNFYWESGGSDEQSVGYRKVGVHREPCDSATVGCPPEGGRY